MRNEIQKNTSTGRPPLMGVSPDPIILSILKTEYASLYQLWRICNSAISEYAFEEGDNGASIDDITERLAPFYSHLSPIGRRIFKTESEFNSNPDLDWNLATQYTNEAAILRRKLMVIVDQLCCHSAGILAKSRIPLDHLAVESCLTMPRDNMDNIYRQEKDPFILMTENNGVLSASLCAMYFTE